jgi:hypothetical protein
LQVCPGLRGALPVAASGSTASSRRGLRGLRRLHLQHGRRRRLSATATRQLATGGLAYLNPLNVRGELALGLMWTQLIDNIFPGSGQRNQTGWEVYWRVLMTPNLWITPGLQVVYNPSFNPGVNTIYIPDIKFRLSF